MNFNMVVEQITAQKSLEFGSIFNNSIELFKKVWLQGLITTLLTIVLIMSFYLLLYMPLIITGITDLEILRQENPSMLIVLLMVVLMPIMMLGIMTVVIALNAAFLKICKLKDLDEMGKDNYFFLKGNIW